MSSEVAPVQRWEGVLIVGFLREIYPYFSYFDTKCVAPIVKEAIHYYHAIECFDKCNKESAIINKCRNSVIATEDNTKVLCRIMIDGKSTLKYSWLFNIVNMDNPLDNEEWRVGFTRIFGIGTTNDPNVIFDKYADGTINNTYYGIKNNGDKINSTWFSNRNIFWTEHFGDGYIKLEIDTLEENMCAEINGEDGCLFEEVDLSLDYRVGIQIMKGDKIELIRFKVESLE